MTSLKWLFIWLLFFLPASTNAGIEIVEEDALQRGGTPQIFKIDGNGQSWSFTKDDKEFIRTCGDGSVANFWLITKHVDISSSIADVIYVDVEAELNLCYNPLDNKHLPCPFNFFEVYIYRGDSKPNIDSKNLFVLFSPLFNITNNSSTNATLPRQNLTFYFYPNKTESVTFAVRSRGACGNIYHMKMYYYFCEETFVKSIRLRKTPSPRSGYNRVTANCSENSRRSDNATSLEGFCYSNGSWSMNKQFECLCIEGHMPNTTLGCIPCSFYSFKNRVSNSACSKCPLRSISNSDRTSCECRNGSYKNPNGTSSACYELLALKEKPKIKYNKSNATITWNPSDKSESLNETILYDVECFLCQNNICNSTCPKIKYIPRRNSLTETSVVVTKLQPGKKYVFRVYPWNSLNLNISKEEWKFQNATLFTDNKPTRAPSSESNGSDTTGKMIITVVVVVLVALAFSLAIFVYRRKGTKKKKHMETFLNSGVDLPSDGLKPYVDPTNYSNVEDAVLDFANELDPRSIFLERLIGGGEFGDVYKGELTTSNGSKILIAAKTLKHDASSKSSRDFLLEASVMAQFNNPNIVRMEGVITKTKPRMIIIEYMSNGSLDNYLKSNDGMLTRLQLLGMARGVAAGMSYLAEINFVHRDLAARNILVNDSLLCKISDFGLSRELESTENSLGEYATSGGKIPIRWTAPEAIKYRKFSTASDVWSFGILLWEIISFAQRPYWDWDNFKVMEEVDNGYRLPPPQKCPTGVHGLMLHCWKAERSERPSFSQITIVIDRWIRSPETLDDEINFFITIGDWLTSIKMGSYKSSFIEAGYRKQSDIVNLSDDDLKIIGVTLIGHRNKIMKGIETLKVRKTRQSMPL